MCDVFPVRAGQWMFVAMMIFLPEISAAAEEAVVEAPVVEESFREAIVTEETVQEETAREAIATEETVQEETAALVIDCASCTPEEKLQLRIRRARAVAAEMNALLREVRPLTGHEAAINILLKDSTSPAAHDLSEALRLARETPSPPTVRQRPAASAPPPPPALRVVFAQVTSGANPASAVLRIGTTDISVRAGKPINHQGRELTLKDVRDTNNGLIVVLEDINGKEFKPPWQ